MQYVPIVNAERSGDIHILLSGPPRAITMHWDSENKRTQLCMLAFDRGCSFCDREQPQRSYHYAPCLLCDLVGDKEIWRKAIVQLPLGFVSDGGVKLCSGRWIKAGSLNRPGIDTHWHVGKLDQREIKESVDVLEVLSRIKGVTKDRPALKIYEDKTA